MTFLRIVTVVFALALVGGEAARSWGVERAPMLWIDDVLIGAALITAALLVGRDSFRRRAFFSGVWGVVVGALYISAFATWFDPVTVQIGAFSLLQMQILVGVALGVASLCLLASLLVPHAGVTRLDVVGEHEFLKGGAPAEAVPMAPVRDADAPPLVKPDASQTAAE